jgi:hypothetical protein
MIPHPITWQNARERERQALLVAAERYDFESRALVGSTCRTLGARRRIASILHTAPLVPRLTPDPRPRAILAGQISALRRIRIRDPRLLTR